MALTVSEKDRATLERWVNSRAVTEQQKLRAKLSLMTADGAPSQAVLEAPDPSIVYSDPNHTES